QVLEDEILAVDGDPGAVLHLVQDGDGDAESAVSAQFRPLEVDGTTRHHQRAGGDLLHRGDQGASVVRGGHPDGAQGRTMVVAHTDAGITDLDTGADTQLTGTIKIPGTAHRAGDAPHRGFGGHRQLDGDLWWDEPQRHLVTFVGGDCEPCIRVSYADALVAVLRGEVLLTGAHPQGGLGQAGGGGDAEGSLRTDHLQLGGHALDGGVLVTEGFIAWSTQADQVLPHP